MSPLRANFSRRFSVLQIMKSLRIGLILALGVIWALYGPSDFIFRVLGLLLIGAVIYWTTRLIFGKEAAENDPLAAEPVPSLNLSERALEESRSPR